MSDLLRKANDGIFRVIYHKGYGFEFEPIHDIQSFLNERLVYVCMYIWTDRKTFERFQDVLFSFLCTWKGNIYH